MESRARGPQASLLLVGRLGTPPSLFSAALQHAAMLEEKPMRHKDAENVPFVSLNLLSRRTPCGT